ncbi:MAG TPA: diguanylate cyclase, partial [Phycisphaerales bacterium]|nr:diguanylate cyclase [Phycisphaerales bacterium]
MNSGPSIPSHHRILVIDDNAAIHDDFRKILCDQAATDDLDDLEARMFGKTTSSRTEQYELVSAFQGQEGLEKVRHALQRNEPFALAFVDMRMPPGWDGLETIEQLWRVDPELQIVICTAYTDHSRDEILERTGRSHRLVILKKPFDNIEIAQLACAMTEKWRASKLASLKMTELENEVATRTQALKASEERFALAARGSNDGLWDWDLSADRMFYSDRWMIIAGVASAAADGSPDLWFSRVHPDDVKDLKAAIKNHLDGKSEHFESEHRLLRSDGQYVWVLCRGQSIRDGSGKPTRMAGSMSDISRMKETEVALRQGAFYDRLTGLPNRALFKQCLERAFDAAKMDSKWKFSVIFIDCDRFKLVNDSLGHLAGDQLLLQIATRLTRLVVGKPSMTLSRLGGDEFVLLVENISDKSGATRTAQSIHDLFNEPFKIQGHTIHTTASIGIAIGDEGYLNAEEVLRDADTAMYHAKTTGRAQNVLFNPSMRDHVVSRLRLENDLRTAIDHDQITLMYQPIVCLKTNQVSALEALARWNHSKDVLITPDRFITIAEET